MITIKVDSYCLKEAEAEIVKRVEARKPAILKQLGERLTQSIKVLSRGEIEVVTTIDNEHDTVKVTSYGPKALRVEREVHPFEYTAASIHDIIKAVEW